MTAWSPEDGAAEGPEAQPAAEAADPSFSGDEPTHSERRVASVEGPTDEALIAAIARKRDRAAFALIFQRYGARIKGYMIRAGASADAAEEAAQEALLAVWRRAETFDAARATAPAWIFAIARNKRIDLIRRAARFEPVEDDPSLAPAPPTPADQVLAGEARDASVRRALAELTDDQREVVTLAFYEGCAHSEIAERLGLPLGTVKSRLRLAFGKLRAILGSDFQDELLDL